MQRGARRPTRRELDRKLKGARDAIEKGQRLFAEPEKLIGELNAFGLGDTKEVWPLILKLLPEISAAHYDGKHPPDKSYEKAILGKEIFPFCWDSKAMGKKMYLKFALNDETFYLLSLHETRF